MSIHDIKNMADHVKSFGRNGDSLLVHMNPVEVEGIASLVPGGLTTNPVTGQLEAFKLMDAAETFLPMLAAYGGGAALTAMTGGAAAPLAVAMASGVSSGVATGALTGDWERGLASGLIGGGIGGAMGAAGNAAAGEVGKEVVGGGITDLAIDNIGQEAGTMLGDVAQQEALQQAMGNEVIASGVGNTGALTTSASLPGTAPPAYMDVGKDAFLGDPSMSNLTADSYKNALKQPFNAPKGEGMGSQMMKPQNAMPMIIGASSLADMNAQDKSKSAAKDQEEEDNQQRTASYDRLQAAYRGAQPDAETGLSDWRKNMSSNIPPPWQPPRGYAAGGYTTMGVNRDDYGRGKGGQEEYDKAMAKERSDNLYGGIDPVTVQRNLRGAHSVGPPANSGFRPGFDPEFMYFQDDPQNIQVPELTSPQQWNNMYRPFERISPEVSPTSTEPPSAVKPSPQTTQPVTDDGLAQGGEVLLNVGGRTARLAAGGVADIQNQFTNATGVPQTDNPAPPQAQAAAGGQPSDQDIQQLAMALTGQAGDNADKIVEGFVQKFGPEVFAEARDFILQQLQPNSQTSGMVQGQGGGMDDQVQGTIGGQQPVAVSPGEYIMPADVVSGLGDGSSDAGAAVLDEMQTKVRKARGGSIEQPAAIDPSKVMPV